MESDPRKQAYRTGLQREYQWLMEALDDVNTGRVFEQNSVTNEEIANLERAVMSMRTQLRPLIQSRELVELWERYEIDNIPSECGVQRTETTVSRDWKTETTVTKTVHAPIGRLEQFSEGLMRVYTTLGFAPEVEESAKQTKIDGELLKEVDQWRENNIQR